MVWCGVEGEGGWGGGVNVEGGRLCSRDLEG